MRQLLRRAPVCALGIALVTLLLPRAGSAQTPQTHTVTVGSLTFSPSSLTINVGDSVTFAFTNPGEFNSVVQESDEFACSSARDALIFHLRTTLTATFTTAGTFR